jgi:hypothetical protein
MYRHLKNEIAKVLTRVDRSAAAVNERTCQLQKWINTVNLLSNVLSPPVILNLSTFLCPRLHYKDIKSVCSKIPPATTMKQVFFVLLYIYGKQAWTRIEFFLTIWYKLFLSCRFLCWKHFPTFIVQCDFNKRDYTNIEKANIILCTQE